MNLVDYFKAKLHLNQDPGSPLAPGKSLIIGMLPLILADDVSHLGSPTQDPDWIVTIKGSGHITGDLSFDRLHLDAKRFLDVMAVETGFSGRLFEELDVIFPTTTDEWVFWDNPGDGQIGYFAINVDKQQGPVTFNRHWRKEEGTWAQPVALSEEIHGLVGQEVYGARHNLALHSCMLFSRFMSVAGRDVPEYLLVDLLSLIDTRQTLDEDDQDLAGTDDDPRVVERSIRIYAGIDLDPIDIKFA